MNRKQITKEEALELLKNSDGKIFGVTFLKKDGTIRDMVARIHVSKGVKGVGMAYSPEEKGLFNVFDMQKNGFRMVNVNTILRVKANGEELMVGERG